MYLCVKGIVTKPVSSQESERSCICVLWVSLPSLYQARKVRGHVFVCYGYRYLPCTKPGKWAIMYLCVKGIDCASFYDFDILFYDIDLLFWDCSDSNDIFFIFFIWFLQVYNFNQDGCICFTGVLSWVLSYLLCVVLLCFFTFWVPCCDVPYDFRSVRLHLHLFVGGLMSYLRYL